MRLRVHARAHARARACACVCGHGGVCVRACTCMQLFEGHKLLKSVVDVQRIPICDICNVEMSVGKDLFSCFICDFDACESCEGKASTATSEKKATLPKKPKSTPSSDIKSNASDKKAGRVSSKVATKKFFSREELTQLKRSELRELAKKHGLAQSGTELAILAQVLVLKCLRQPAHTPLQFSLAIC